MLKLSKRNYFEIVTSFLFFVLGLVIFIRSLRETGFILGMGAGAAFFAYGVFRLRYIWRFFISRDQKS
jgi:Na+/H+ antiporter NhaD/arsenite permease-like protein